MAINLGYNPGAAVTGLYVNYFDMQEKKLNNQYIDGMAKTNIEIKIISDVMNRLSHAKKNDEEVDFSNDETMKRCIAHIHKNNPTIFEELIKGVPEYTDPDENSLMGDEITLENVLNNSLKDVAMSGVTIKALTKDEIDVITQGLDSQLKMHTADLNEHMMRIQDNLDNRTQMAEFTRKSVEMNSDLNKSIINRSKT
jgi:hypothetical protein